MIGQSYIGIQWVYGSSVVVKTQGRVEYSIGVCKGIIRKSDDENPTKWAEILPSMQFTFNNRYPYYDDGYTPSILLYGFQPQESIQNIIRKRLFKDVPLPINQGEI